MKMHARRRARLSVVWGALCLVGFSSCVGGPHTRGSPDVLVEQGRLDEAIPVLEARVKQAPRGGVDDVASLKLLGEAYAKAGRDPEAAGVLRKATLLDSRDPRAWALLGEVLFRLEERQEAAAAWHAALKHDRTNEHYHAQLKAVLEGVGMYEQYVGAVRELLVTGPEQVGLLNTLGQQYLEAGHARAAADAFKGSLSVEPVQPGVRTSLGLALARVPMYEEAAEACG